MFLISAGTSHRRYTALVSISERTKNDLKKRLRTFSLDNQAAEPHLCLGFS
jgi:hypothetical protein